MSYLFKRELYPNIKDDDGQFPEMVLATVITSVISIIATVAIISAYVYIRLNNPAKANRVSLRCVFLSSVMNLINSIFDICTILKDGDTAFCRATSIITLFTRIMGVIFLTLVGVNLILVFVFKVKTNVRELECIYYCVAVLYGLVSISVPISLQSQEKADEIVKNYRCYYYIYYDQFFDHSSFLWTWFYSFLFFAIFAAAICSVTATVKLTREQRIITEINSEPVNAEINNGVLTYDKNKSSIFKRVVVRCVMYPLVPLVSNVWGLIFQLLLNYSKITYENNLPLSLLDIIFGCLQGFFVSIVFFSDPTMVDFIQTKVDYLKCKQSKDSGLAHEQSEARLITPTTSFKESYISSPPTALRPQSYRDGSCCENSQETIAQIPAAYDVGGIPSKSERRFSLASDYTLVI